MNALAYAYVRSLGPSVDQHGAATPAGQSRSGPAAVGTRQRKQRTRVYICLFPSLPLTHPRGPSRFPLGYCSDTRYIYI